MTAKLKITSIGNSAGVILPKEVLEKLRVGKGDTLFLTETPMGFELSPLDEKIQRQMAVAEQVMRDNRNLLHRLAQVGHEFAKNRRRQPAAQQPQQVYQHALGAVTGHDGTASHRLDKFIEKGRISARQCSKEHRQ